MTENNNSASASSGAQEQMRKSFILASKATLANEDFYRKPKITIKMGLEVEYSLLNMSYHQASEQQRDAIVSANPTIADTELGASQLETRTPPYNLLEAGLDGFLDLATQTEERVKVSARANNVFLLRAGVNPIVWIHKITRTSKEKYQQVPSFHNDNRKPGTNTKIGVPPYLVEAGDAAVIALCNSVQFNIEAQDFSDAVDKLNRSLMISPFVTGICANARFIADRDTKLSDLRNIAWEVSHDTRTPEETAAGAVTRVGMPKDYYKGMDDYLSQIAEQPFILDNPEAAFPIGIGLNWRDARIKFIENSLVVEFRPVSTQTTAAENVAASLFYLGRLDWSQRTKEPMIPFQYVRSNKDEVMKNGIKGKLWYLEDNQVKSASSLEVLENELERAREGLRMLGLEEKEFTGFFDILKSRFSKGTPVDQFAKHVFKHRGMSRDFSEPGSPALHEALILAMSDSKII